jgi:DUF1680 family protein
MKREQVFRWMILLIIAPCFLPSTEVHGIEDRVAPQLNRPQASSTQFDGIIKKYLDAVVSNWLVTLPQRNPAILEMFADRELKPPRDLLPWSGEFAGKHLTASVLCLRASGDERLQRATLRFVEDLVNVQGENGYLGPFPKRYQLTGRGPNIRGKEASTWDLWGHYHAMLGLMLWYDQTGHKESLDAAVAIADLLCEKFLNSPQPVSSTGSTEMNQAVAHSLAMLYRRTGQEKYLQLAEDVVADFSAPGAGDYLRSGLKGVEFFKLPKPRWESLHPIMGLAELYWITGNTDYRQAFENLWWSIAEFDRHNNGGFSSGERAQGNPYDPRAIETCCTIAWMAMSIEMLKLTGNPIVADELELSMFNQVLASFASSGKWSTYNTPMDGVRIPSTTDIAFQIRPGSEELNCCSVNAPRGLGMLSEWAIMHDREGLVLNWLGPAEYITKINGHSVRIKVLSDYPRTGEIKISVTPESPSKFALRVRIPHWSRTNHLSVNNETLATKSGSYATLHRKWQQDDQVLMTVDMSPRFWVGEREAASKASVYHGPILLVREGEILNPPTFEGTWRKAGASQVSQSAGDTVTYKFDGTAVEWHGNRYDDAGQARIVIDGKEREVVDQYAPKRGTPFVWSCKELNPGSHTLVLEVTGDKPVGSRGTWINVTKLIVPQDTPSFTLENLRRAELRPSSPGAIVTYDLKDREGKAETLRDFGTAGQNGRSYSSWLPVVGVTQTRFSKENPSRTSTGHLR